MTNKMPLIVYASKRGTTRDVVDLINQKLPMPCHSYDCTTKQFCTKESVSILTPNQLKLYEYSFILIGTPMYIGAPLKVIKQFFIKHEAELLFQDFGLFTCGVGSEDEDYGYLRKHMQADLIEKALCYYHLGGEIREDRMNLLEQLAMKEYVKQHGPVKGIDMKALEQLCNFIKDKLQ